MSLSEKLRAASAGYMEAITDEVSSMGLDEETSVDLAGSLFVMIAEIQRDTLALCIEESIGSRPAPEPLMLPEGVLGFTEGDDGVSFAPPES